MAIGCRRHEFSWSVRGAGGGSVQRPHRRHAIHALGVAKGNKVNLRQFVLLSKDRPNSRHFPLFLAISQRTHVKQASGHLLRLNLALANSPKAFST